MLVMFGTLAYAYYTVPIPIPELNMTYIATARGSLLLYKVDAMVVMITKDKCPACTKFEPFWQLVAQHFKYKLIVGSLNV